MALTREPRHWIRILLASAWAILAIIQVADFSGEPAPRWRTVSLAILALICIGLLVYDSVWGRRHSNEASAPGPDTRPASSGDER